MVDQDPLPRWSFGRVTLLGDAAHPMVPRGSNGAGQAILDARALTSALLEHGDPVAALAAYEKQRLEATTRIVLTNRTNPPDAILREVFQRTDDRPFAPIDDVISHEELVALSEGYKQIAGYSKDALRTRRRRWTIVPLCGQSKAIQVSRVKNEKSSITSSTRGGTTMASSSTPCRRAAHAIDVADFIDRQPVGGFQLRLLLTCAAVLFLDGFDTQAIGYVAPALAKEWGLTKGALGPVFSAGLFGLMIGALRVRTARGPLGRKKIIIFSTLAFGVCALATAFVQDANMLLAIRFLTGLGLGGAMPNAIAMTSEFNPRRRRATMVMIMFCGFSVGAALGGLLAAALIPQFGWRSVFVVGGVAPLLLVPILALRLPESVRFLALTGAPMTSASPHCFDSISPKAVFAPGRGSSCRSRRCREFRCCIFSGTDEPRSRCCCGSCSS